MKKMRRLLASFLAMIMSFGLSAEVYNGFGEGALYDYSYSKDNIDAYYIIGLETPPLSHYEQAKKDGVREFILTSDGKSAYEEITTEHKSVKSDIAKLIGRTPEVNYDYTASYNGFSMALSYNEVMKLQQNSQQLGIANIEYGDVFELTAMDNENKAEESQSPLSYADITERVFDEIGVSEARLDGDGMVIAVIDNEFDTKHEFLSMPDGITGKLSKEDVKAVYPYLSASPYVSEKCYVNDKIPFAFDYYEYDFNPFIDYGSHGTHVAGIAAGNGDTETDKIYNPDGIASGAQLVLLATQSFSYTSLMAAYDDALFLGADVINASYGASYAAVGISRSEFDAIRNITNTGTVFCNAAGNSGKSVISSEIFTDYSTSGSPTNISGVLAVGSANNPVYSSAAGTIILSDGSEEIIVNSSYYALSDEYADEKIEYVVVSGTGSASDYENIDVTDKIALVQISDDSIYEVAENACSAGAAGLIMYNDNNTEIFDIEVDILPSGMVSYETGMRMIKAKKKTVSFRETVYTVRQSENVSMSDFSSWAFTEQLLLSPDISGFGGNIVSSVADGDELHKSYEVYSGTSMSSPQLAGVTALLKEHLLKNKEKYGIENRSDFTELSAKLLMSVAVPVYTYDTLEIASPRVQGNGLVNINSAVNTPCYVSSDSEKDNYRPKISLGDGYRQNYEFTFNITNISEKDCTYTPSVQLFKDTAEENGELSTNTLRLSENTDFTAAFTDEFGNKTGQITVPAESTVKLTAKISLSDEVYNRIKNNNGRFVDGFVRLSGENKNPNLTLSFMAFCGNWAYTDKGGIAFGFIYDDKNDFDSGACLVDYSGNIAGCNIFDSTISVPCFSPNGDNIYDSLGLLMMFKRRCYDLTAAIYNSDGEQLYSQNLGVGCNQETFFGVTGSGYSIDWDFKENGKIQDGAEYKLEITARLPLSDEMKVIDSCVFKIDNQPPKIKKVGKLTIDDCEFLVIDADDNNELQGGIVYANGELADAKSANCSVSGGKLIVDVTYADKDASVQVYDVAGNHITIWEDDVTYTLSAEQNDWFGYATVDDESFCNDGFFILDADYNPVELDIQLSETPSEIYGMYDMTEADVMLLIDGFETTYKTVKIGIWGDSNSDSIFNVRDAAFTAKMLSNRTDYEYEEFIASIGGYCADCNNDGTVTVRDAAMAAKTLAEKIHKK